MVRGSPRHSQSNGGIERMNCTVQRKLGAWMDETGSKRWSVGCKLVQWRINTQINRTIGNETSYKLVFGQKPRVGLSALPLHMELIDTIATEGQLNRILGLNETDELERSVTTVQASVSINSITTTQDQAIELSPSKGVTFLSDMAIKSKTDASVDCNDEQNSKSSEEESVVHIKSNGFCTEIVDSTNTSVTKRATMCVNEALDFFYEQEMTPLLLDKFHGVSCDFLCSTCQDTFCTDIKVVNVGEKSFYKEMSSGTEWWSTEMVTCFATLLAHDMHHSNIMYLSCLYPKSCDAPTKLAISDKVQSIVSLAYNQSHFAVLHFDLIQNVVSVYDGLQYEINTWKHHIDRILACLGQEVSGCSTQWNVVIKTSIDERTEENGQAISILQTDSFSCGPIAAVSLWALFDFDTCFESVVGTSSSAEYRPVVISHFMHLLEKHDHHLSYQVRKKESFVKHEDRIDVVVGKKGPTPKMNETMKSEDEEQHMETSTKETDIFVSPKRKALRDDAFSSLQKAAKKMKSNVELKEKPIKVGDVVQFSVENIDKNKTDPGTLTVVVIGIDYKKNGPLYTVASAKGILKERFHRNKLTVIPSVTPKLLGLEDVFQSHEGMAEISVRQAISQRSLHGKQGMRRCDCKGDCQTSRCSCFRSGHICNSRCHMSNNKCCANHC